MRRLCAVAFVLAASAAAGIWMVTWDAESWTAFRKGFLLGFGIAPAHAAETVIASTYWIGDGTVARNDYRTSSGQRYDAKAMHVASPDLPLGTKLYLRHGRCAAEVTVSDRGPFVRGRKLDVTPAVSNALCLNDLGRVIVEIWPPLPRERKP